MEHEKRAHFLPAEIDEQIDQYLEPQLHPQPTANAQTASPAEHAARQAVQNLQQHFAPSEAATERLQHVWQRLESHQLELAAQSVEYNKHFVPQVTDLSQRRKRHMSKHLSLADGPVASRSGQRFSLFSTLIAVACAILIVGGTIFTLQRLRVGQNQPAAQPTLTPATLTEDSGVYTYTELGEYYKLDAVTHKELWHFIVPQNNNRMRLSRPIVKNGLLYMLNAGNDGYDVYALNTSDGSIKWEKQALSIADHTNLSVSLGDLVVTNDTVYYAVFSLPAGYSVIHSLSATTGKSNWDARYANTGTRNDASAGMIIQGVTDNVLYAATLTGDAVSPTMKLYALDLRNSGKLLWSTGVPAIVSNGGVAILNGVAYNGAFYYGGPGQDIGSVLYAYDIHGVQKRFYLPGGGQITNVVEANGVLYAGTRQFAASGVPDAGSVNAIRPQDGKVLWQYSTEGSGGSSIPTVWNGIVYVTFSASDNRATTSTFPIVALDATSGNKLWQREILQSVGDNIQPLIDARFVYLSSAAANPFKTIVTLLNLSDGSPAGNFTIHSALNSESSLLVVVP